MYHLLLINTSQIIYSLMKISAKVQTDDYATNVKNLIYFKVRKRVFRNMFANFCLQIIFVLLETTK